LSSFVLTYKEKGKSQAIELSRHDNYRLIKQAYSGTIRVRTAR